MESPYCSCKTRFVYEVRARWPTAAIPMESPYCSCKTRFVYAVGARWPTAATPIDSPYCSCKSRHVYEVRGGSLKRQRSTATTSRLFPALDTAPRASSRRTGRGRRHRGRRRSLPEPVPDQRRHLRRWATISPSQNKRKNQKENLCFLLFQQFFQQLYQKRLLKPRWSATILPPKTGRKKQKERPPKQLLRVSSRRVYDTTVPATRLPHTGFACVWTPATHAEFPRNNC